jgi:hypothetical protein
VIVAETNWGAVTVRADEPLMVLSVAVIVVFPALWLVAKPALLMVANVELLDVQVAVDVRSRLVPSE